MSATSQFGKGLNIRLGLVPKLRYGRFVFNRLPRPVPNATHPEILPCKRALAPCDQLGGIGGGRRAFA